MISLIQRKISPIQQQISILPNKTVKDIHSTVNDIINLILYFNNTVNDITDTILHFNSMVNDISDRKRYNL